MNKIDITFSNKEYNLFNKDLKYNPQFKRKDWVKNVTLEAENNLKFV